MAPGVFRDRAQRPQRGRTLGNTRSDRWEHCRSLRCQTRRVATSGGAWRGQYVDVWSALGLLLRRWYVVAAGLLVTAGVVISAFQAIPPEFSANSQFVLVGPSGQASSNSSQPSERTLVNPLLALGQGYVNAAELMAKIMNGEAS